MFKVILALLKPAAPVFSQSSDAFAATAAFVFILMDTLHKYKTKQPVLKFRNRIILTCHMETC